MRKVLSILVSLCLMMYNFPYTKVHAEGTETSVLDNEMSVKVSNIFELKEALDNDSASIIVVTQTIPLSGDNLDGKGKTIRVEKLGMNDSGLASEEGSSYSVFSNSGSKSSISNMIIRGGRTTALKNYGTLILDNVTIRDVYVGSSHGGGIYNSGNLFIKNSSLTRNLADAGGGFFTNGSSSLMIMENSTCSENYSIADGGGAGEISGFAT